MLTFNAIDVETANADRASICQIGIVHVRDGAIHDRWQTLINPKDWFDPWNVSIHGITPDDVRNSPTLPEVRDELRRRLRGTVVASHTAFDRVAFERAMTRHNLEQLQVTWLDSAKIARRTWPDRYARKGWGLKNVAGDLGIAFKHHDALEDARAAAQVVLHACAASETDIEQWLTRLAEPITARTPRPRRDQKHQGPITRTGNVEGALHGETIAFTGALSMRRHEAADLAAAAGCNIAGSVTKKVSIIVVGVQDKNVLNGYEKSRKHRQAEALIAKGMNIEILSEDDFSELVGIEGTR